MPKLLTKLTSVAVFSLLTASSQATIYWTVAQDGNNVRATASGSLSLPVRIDVTSLSGSTSAHYDAFLLSSIESTSSSLISRSNSADGVGHGPIFPAIRGRPGVDGTVVTGTFYTWGGTLGVDAAQIGNTLDPGERVYAVAIFQNKTLADLGVSVTDAERVIWQHSGSSDIANAVVLRIAASVPEPSSAVLGALGVFCLVARRKR